MAKQASMAELPETDTPEVPVAPPAKPDKDEAMLDLLKEQQASFDDVIASLKGEIKELKDRPVPTSFKPMETPDLHGGAARMRAFEKAMANPGTPTSTTKQKPVGSNGLILDESVTRRYPRRFDGGSRVRINREATREGSAVTWAKRLEQEGSEGFGVITKCYRLMKTGHWKWQAKIEGLELDAYADYELEPA